MPTPTIYNETMSGGVSLLSPGVSAFVDFLTLEDGSTLALDANDTLGLETTADFLLLEDGSTLALDANDTLGLESSTAEPSYSATYVYIASGSGLISSTAPVHIFYYTTAQGGKTLSGASALVTLDHPRVFDEVMSGGVDVNSTLDATVWFSLFSHHVQEVVRPPKARSYIIPSRKRVIFTGSPR